jgi:D-aminoacyl-tRNA deacylase
VSARALVIVSDVDPVAAAVAAKWGTPPATGDHVEGTPIRRLTEQILVLRRSGPHVHDERLDLRLPASLREGGPTLVFPSIHRSERNVPCLTVHPLGNPGERADVGGAPRTLAPTDARAMATVLRLLDEGGTPLGWNATYEATHHGPAVELPAFFVEIGYGDQPSPPDEAVRVLAGVLPRIASDPTDRIALGVGGGHYVPHFTDLALHRRWAFGHLLSRHALAELDSALAAEAFSRSVGAEGVVYARAEDARHPALARLGPRLRDADAPPRERGDPLSTTGDARSASGT